MIINISIYCLNKSNYDIVPGVLAEYQLERRVYEATTFFDVVSSSRHILPHTTSPHKDLRKASPEVISTTPSLLLQLLFACIHLLCFFPRYTRSCDSPLSEMYECYFELTSVQNFLKWSFYSVPVEKREFPANYPTWDGREVMFHPIWKRISDSFPPKRTLTSTSHINCGRCLRDIVLCHN